MHHLDVVQVSGVVDEILYQRVWYGCIGTDKIRSPDPTSWRQLIVDELDMTGPITSGVYCCRQVIAEH